MQLGCSKKQIEPSFYSPIVNCQITLDPKKTLKKKIFLQSLNTKRQF